MIGYVKCGVIQSAWLRPLRRQKWPQAARWQSERLRHGAGDLPAGRFGINQFGFTMIELMVVIAIASILAAIAVPALTGVVNDIRQKSAINLLASDLNYARSEAIKRNLRILVCARNSAGTGCETVSPSWDLGWVVCVDVNANGVCGTGTTGLISARTALASQMALSARDSAATPAVVTSVRFNANSTQGAGALNVNFTLAGNWTGATTRTAAVANTGNVTTQ